MASLRRVQRTWESLGRSDPLWAVFTRDGTEPGAWDEQDFLDSGRAVVARVLAELDDLDVLVPPGPALDFGCGVGRISLALADHMDEIHGVDISEPMIARAREMAAGRDPAPEYHLNVNPDLRIFADGTFAFAASFIVLQHMPPQHALSYVREFVRVLAPGGVAVFQIPASYGRPTGLLDDRRLPPRVRNAAVRWRGRIRRRAVMEMYPIRRRRVEREVEGAGGIVRAVLPDNLAGDLCVSVHYVVTKPG
jgi:SAM-dependent methyltransferase